MKYLNEMKSILLLRQICSFLLAPIALDWIIAGIEPYIFKQLVDSEYILYAYQAPYEAFQAGWKAIAI